MSFEVFGNFADWVAAFGSVAAAFVAWSALKYARKAYEAQSAQLEIQQREIKEDMVARQRLRLAHGPLLEVTNFEYSIEGLEVSSGAVIRSKIVINPGAWKDTSDHPLKFDSEISTGFRCIAIHNYRSTIRLGLVKIRCLDRHIENLRIARVSKVRRFHINADWQPDQMWAILVPDSTPPRSESPLRLLFDFETEDKFFDRYEMELDLAARSVKQISPIPFFNEPYDPQKSQ
ncbi:MAG: hypothetical protein V4689_09610 [Verrucomicrobiota bacterium]